MNLKFCNVYISGSDLPPPYRKRIENFYAGKLLKKYNSIFGYTKLLNKYIDTINIAFDSTDNSDSKFIYEIKRRHSNKFNLELTKNQQSFEKFVKKCLPDFNIIQGNRYTRPLYIEIKVNEKSNFLTESQENFDKFILTLACFMYDQDKFKIPSQI